MKRIVKSASMALYTCLMVDVFASCSVDDFISNRNETSKQNKFDFNTSNEVSLNIDYGPLASKSLVQVYSENPLEEATAEDQSPKGDLVFSAFLNESGCFNGSINLPGHIDHLYFYTSSMAGPQVLDAKVDGNDIDIDGTATRATRAIPQTRAVPDNELIFRKLNDNEKSGSADNFYTITGSWDEYGKAQDINHIMDEGKLTGDDVLSIEHYFWMGSTTKPSGVSTERAQRINSMKVNNVNMVVQEKYEEDGITYDVESAEVWFTFLTEYAWYENTVGYYYFDMNNPPKSPSDIDKKFVILPNSSKPNHYPFDQTRTDYVYPIEKCPTHTNQRVQLVYVDKDGKASVHFPPNVEIGFFLISNGFQCGNYLGEDMIVDGKTYKIRKAGRINTDGVTYYSNAKFNSNAAQRYVACRLQNGTVVYGAEDGSDGSYDDMMFTITASPNKAIHTEGGNTLTSIPQQKIERKYTDVSEKYTYAFEDLWPNGGDYDMNDVVIRHSRKITKDQFNDVTKVVDDFSFDNNTTTNSINAFAIQLPAGHRGDKYTIPSGCWYEESTGSYFITDDVHKVFGKTVSIEREFEHPISFAEIQNELNPFIVNQTKGVGCKSEGRIEIHLPMGEVTSMGMKVDNVKNPAQAWYISDDGQYPYALKISGLDFVPCDHQVRIGSGAGAYPNFNKWVKSLGKEYKEWYKNK